jgi:hypothetical protein
VSTSNLEASQQLDIEAPRQRASVKLATSSIARHTPQALPLIMWERLFSSHVARFSIVVGASASRVILSFYEL